MGYIVDKDYFDYKHYRIVYELYSDGDIDFSIFDLEGLHQTDPGQLPEADKDYILSLIDSIQYPPPEAA
jgi:hypothetical protein